MATLPYTKFYPGDWLRDTRALTCSAKGAWIDLICAMWNAPEPGILCMRLPAYGRIVGLPEERIVQVIDELSAYRICDREDLPTGEVRLTCRRIVRDYAEMEAAHQEISTKRAEAARKRWTKPKPGHADDPPHPAEPSMDANAMQMECTWNANQNPEARIQNDFSLPPPSNANTPRRPTLEQAIAAAQTIGLTAEEADTWWHGREASDWRKATINGGSLPVGSNWQADLKCYVGSMRQTQAAKAARAAGASRSAPHDHRAEKAAREFPEPERPVPML